MKSLSLKSLILAITMALPMTAKADFSIDDLRGDGSLILASESDFERIRNAEWDPAGMQYLEFLRRTADAMLETELVRNEKIGMRLLERSREFLKRVSTFALMYRIDGNDDYLNKAIAEMENVAAFPDWNPSHYLDVGEMALGLAIGTDWLWDSLDTDQRERFLNALLEKGIQPSLDEEHPDNWWLYYNNNWNPVCHSGIVAAALLNAERHPELAEQVIKRALRAVPYAMAETDPDGIYTEGPIYWGYGTEFTAIFLNLIDHAFGSTYGLDERPSLQKSMLWRTLMVAPSGDFYNFYDNPKQVGFSPAPAWFASHFENKAGLYETFRSLRLFLEDPDWRPGDAHHRLLPLLAIWYPDGMQVPEDPNDLNLPLNWEGEGSMPMAIVRSDWGDPNALFLAFKGGRGSISHAHMDNGSFVFEDKGVRWAIELDPQNYNSLETVGLGLWDRRQHADRWRVFRIGPHSHNILMIDQRDPDVEAQATISEFVEEGNQVRGTVELSSTYVDQVNSYQRHYTVHDSKVAQITDVVRGARPRTERQGRQPATLRWRMITEAIVNIRGDEAVLSQDGQLLYFRVISPDSYYLHTAPVDPTPYFWDALNPGVSALDIWLKANDDGDQTVTVLMSTDPKALESVAQKIQ